MAGAKFEYDEQGGTFYYFVISFYGLILIPLTYYLWPRKDIKDNVKDSKKCYCDPCRIKDHRKRSQEPWQAFRRKFIKFVLLVAWTGFLLLAYKVAHVKIEHHEYDPYAILGVDRGATDRDIKRHYRKLSLTIHPDRGGDPQKFVQIAKAYEALTNDEVKENWEKYGNPDGPGVTRFGIALPSWIVNKENSFWVLAAYVFAFMIILPTAVGTWWYRSIRFSADQVLVDTSHLYFIFFLKTPNMMLKRIIMVLGSSWEFDKSHNKDVTIRPSDEFEVPHLMKEFPNLGEKNRERPLCFPHSLKSRALIFAHLSRLPLKEDTLDIDRQFIMKKVSILIQEMVNTISHLVMLANAGRIPRSPPIEVLENIMRLSAMLVQALWENKSPLLQLPHLTEDVLRYCTTKKRHIKTCADLSNLSSDDMRLLLRNLTSEQFQDVINVLASMPRLQMTVTVKVQDDEEPEKVTAKALVTVIVKLQRRSLTEASKLSNSNSSNSNVRRHRESDHQYQQLQQHEDSEQNGECLENGSIMDGELQENTVHKATTQAQRKPWEKNKKAKAGKGGKHKKKPQQQKQKIQVITKQVNVVKEPSKEASIVADESRDQSANELDVKRQSEQDSSDEDNYEEEKREAKQILKETLPDQENYEDDDLIFDEDMAKREKILEAKTKITHSVHCPYFPEEKQEWWWIYLCDRKRRLLMTTPAHITTLVKEEQIDLKFQAPDKPGKYVYQVCLRSDSYLDCDQTADIKLNVHEAKEVTSHPQWEFPSDDEEKGSDAAASESEYTEEEVPSDED